MAKDALLVPSPRSGTRTHTAAPESDPPPAASRLASQSPPHARRALRRPWPPPAPSTDRKSTRLNSSHSQISYAVFCLKKKNNLIALFHTRLTQPTTT